VGIACIVAAAPMAWLVSRTDLPGKRGWRTLILASFVTPPFLGAFAWVLLGGPNAGLINQAYYALLGVKPFEASPLINVFSAWGMVFVMALYTFPYVFTFAANALDAVPSELEEASAILGAPAWRTALHVTLPLVLPALLGGFIVAFLQSMTLFGTPAILALPAGVDTMTTRIWSLFQFPPQLGLAAAASLPLLAITVALLRAQSAIMGRKGYSVIGGKSGSAGQMIRLGGWKAPALALFALVLGCSIALPYGVLIRTAFVRNWSAPLEGNLSLEHWRFVFFEFSQTRLALQNTFVLGISAATAGTLLVTLVGYLSLRKLVWGHRYLAFLATAPVAIPGIVLAVGLFLAYTHPPLVLYGTLSIIFLAYVTKELPVGYQQIASSLRAVHPELEDASRIFGATRLRALFDITTPLIRNGVIATWIFIFIGSIRELSATILLFTARTKTISVTMFDLRESNDWGPIAVLSITMLAITFVMIAIIHRFTNVRLK
jgi:iron(III) transport system permease protein